MNAIKYTTTIVVETLSPNANNISHLVEAVKEQLLAESTSGDIVMNDGDTVSWSTVSKSVSI